MNQDLEKALWRSVMHRRSPERSCPDDETIAAFIDGTIEESDHETLIAHLAACHACRELVAESSKERPPKPVRKGRPRFANFAVAAAAVLLLALNLYVFIDRGPSPSGEDRAMTTADRVRRLAEEFPDLLANVRPYDAAELAAIDAPTARSLAAPIILSPVGPSATTELRIRVVSPEGTTRLDISIIDDRGQDFFRGAYADVVGEIEFRLDDKHRPAEDTHYVITIVSDGLSGRGESSAAFTTVSEKDRRRFEAVIAAAATNASEADAAAAVAQIALRLGWLADAESFARRAADQAPFDPEIAALRDAIRRRLGIVERR